MRRKDIQGYEGLYYVTDAGEVWSYDRRVFNPANNSTTFKKGVRLKPCSCNGYLSVGLSVNGTRKSMLVHRIVAINFLQNKQNKPDINHKDGIKSNNCLRNLEWVTEKENTRHAIKIGLLTNAHSLGERNIKSILKEKDVLKIKEMLSLGYRQKEIAIIFNVNASTICHISTKRNWKHLL